MTVRGQTSPVYDRGVLYVGFSDGYFSAIQAKEWENDLEPSDWR